MLDINLFRVEKGGNPDIVRQSQIRRFKDPGLVDQVIALDNEWKAMRANLDNLNRGKNLISKTVGLKMKAKEGNGEDLPLSAELTEKLYSLKSEQLTPLSVLQLKALKGVVDSREETLKQETEATLLKRDAALHKIGNLVHEDVPVSKNEDDNAVLRTFGEPATKPFNHVSVMEALDGIDTVRGSAVAGSRGYFIKGKLFQMAFALSNYAIQFLASKDYTPIYTPFFMNRDAMAKVAQLEQFDEELYSVTGEGDDKFLIATSEQPIAAYHLGQRFHPEELPRKYVGYSSCFRKEAGSHGKDTLGIFRIHQFEKIEQFTVTSPLEDHSWEMMKDMINNSEAFYQSLGLPYRVISIVSGALNNAAAMKWDLEAWFPASQTYRELVSCSNCTDYQSRRLDVRFGQTKTADVDYVHMLNSTLCAVQRALCCIVENYQTEDGVKVPDVLVPFMGGIDFIPFVKKPVAK